MRKQRKLLEINQQESKAAFLTSFGVHTIQSLQITACLLKRLWRNKTNSTLGISRTTTQCDGLRRLSDIRAGDLNTFWHEALWHEQYNIHLHCAAKVHFSLEFLWLG